MRANPGNSGAGVVDDEQLRRAAAEVLRTLRGKRSQRAFAHRLGYRANPITDWEHGRRSTPIAHAAARAGCSRFAMARWLSGEAQPRLPDFFRCVDALTGRLPDLVAELVSIETVPSLLARHRAMRAARRVAFDAPWTEAVLRVLDTNDYQSLAAHDDGFIARQLGIAVEVARAALHHLEAAGVVRLESGLWRQDRPLSVDTRGARDDVSVLLRHWSAVAYGRVDERRSSDLFSYNVMSISRSDYARIRELLRHTFREIRSIVAASEPNEQVALLNMQLLDFG
jgi:hypothetical protein